METYPAGRTPRPQFSRKARALPEIRMGKTMAEKERLIIEPKVLPRDAASGKRGRV